MTALGGATSDRLDVLSRRDEAALWLGSATLVIALHFAGFVWASRPLPDMPAEEAAPPAITIDFAEEATAVAAVAPEVPHEPEIAPPIEPPVDDPPVEPTATEEPPPVDTPPPEATVTPPPVPTEVASPIPDRRPPPKEVRRHAPRTEKRPRPPASAVPTSSAPIAERAAAPSSRETAAGSSAGARADWAARLASHLERRKRYPRDARTRLEQGTVRVRFSIDDAGDVTSATIVASSGHSALDAEVLDLVRRASPVPPPPEGAGRTVVVPIGFVLR